MAGNHAVIGILAALRHRDAHRRGPARRGQPALLGAHRPGQPQLGVGGRRRGALPDGQRAPERVPLRAVPDRGRRPDRRSRPTTGSSSASVGRSASRRSPRTSGSSTTATARGTATAPAAARGAAGQATAEEWFELLTAAGVPCGPINTIDDGFAAAERFGLEPVVEVGEGERALPTTRHPIRFSGTPVELRRCRRRSWTSTAPSCGPGWARRRRDRAADVRDGAGRLQPGDHHPARAGPRPRRHGHASASASSRSGSPPSAAPSPARCGSSRRCWPRWPTTASRPPRSSPG